MDDRVTAVDNAAALIGQPDRLISFWATVLRRPRHLAPCDTA
jgi:hypothetical protein